MNDTPPETTGTTLKRVKKIMVYEIYGCFRNSLKKINPKIDHLQFSSREATEEWKRNNPDFWIIAETEEEQK